MSKKVSNNLKGVNIGGSYTGGDSSSGEDKNKNRTPIIVAIILTIGTIASAYIQGWFSTQEHSDKVLKENSSESVFIQDNRVSATDNGIAVGGGSTININKK